MELNDFKTIKQQWQGSRRRLIWRCGSVCLWHYPAKEPCQLQTPVLMIFALINRPDILDFDHEVSLIENLLNQGIDVYLLDWGYPQDREYDLTIADLFKQFIRRSVHSIRHRHSVEKINLLGVCQGGVFALCYAALYPHYVKHLMTLVTPIDFDGKENIVAQYAKKLDLTIFQENYDYIPGKLFTQFFLSLKPYQLTLGKALTLQQKLSNETQLRRFLSVEKWLYDNPKHPRQIFIEFCRTCYQENLLVKNQLTIANKLVNLNKITMPVLNIYATNDHIVPPASSQVLKRLVATKQYQEKAYDCGHIGLFISPRVVGKLSTDIITWLRTHNT